MKFDAKINAVHLTRFEVMYFKSRAEVTGRPSTELMTAACRQFRAECGRPKPEGHIGIGDITDQQWEILTALGQDVEYYILFANRLSDKKNGVFPEPDYQI